MQVPLRLSLPSEVPPSWGASLALTSCIGHTMPQMPSDWAIFGRVALSFAIGFTIGWEREVRGAAAGDGTCAPVTTASAAAVAVWGGVAPNSAAGAQPG